MRMRGKIIRDESQNVELPMGSEALVTIGWIKVFGYVHRG